jgi:Na+/proline symporter
MIYIIVILTHLFALVLVGAWHARRVRTQEDFAVAGRSLTVPILIGTMLTTWIGTGSLIGNAEKTYQIGIGAIILPVGGVLGIALISVVAARVRRFGQITVLDIIETRFGVTARLLGTVALITAYLTIVSYQYRAGGAVLFRITSDYSWSLQSCTQIAAAFIIIYTVLAGMFSVARTDVANGVIMVIGFMIALPLLLSQAGGLDGMRAAMADTPDKLKLFGAIKGIDVLNFLLPPFLLVMGEANLYQRFFSAKDERTARVSALILIPSIAFVEIMIIVTAWVASAIVPLESDFGHVLLIAAKDHLPVFLGSLLLAACVAIIISTADSFLLVVATSVTRDVYQRFLRPAASAQKLVFVSRVSVVALGLVAYVASQASDEFFSVALWAYTIYGASITPALIATFFWKRATGSAAAASIASGAAVTIAWSLLSQYEMLDAYPTLASMKPVLPAITVSVATLVSVSLCTPKPDPESWRQFVKA